MPSLLSNQREDATFFIGEHKEWLPAMKAGGPELRVAYHDPISLVKGQKIGAQPRNVLMAMAIPGVEKGST